MPTSTWRRKLTNFNFFPYFLQIEMKLQFPLTQNTIKGCIDNKSNVPKVPELFC